MVTAIADMEPERQGLMYSQSNRHHPPALRIRTTADRARMKLRVHARKLNPVTGGALPHELPTLPGIQSLSIAVRYLEGGRVRFVELVQLAVLQRVEVAMRWWVVYADLLPSERMVCSFDDVCAGSGVRPSELMAAVVSVAMEQSVDVGNLVAAAAHPAVVAATIESATTVGGKRALVQHKDREMLFQHAHFIPIKQGIALNVSNHASANAQAAAAADNDPSVPSFSADMHSARAVVRQLGPADESLATIDMSAVTGDRVAAEPQD